MIITYDLASGRVEIEDLADESRLQVTIYGEAAFMLDAQQGVLVVGYDTADDEDDLAVTLVEIASRRWCAAARVP